MNDLESRIAERFDGSAERLAVIRPATSTILALVATRRRRRRARKAGAAVAAALLVVGTAALRVDRDDRGRPDTADPAAAPATAGAGPATTGAAVASTRATSPGRDIALDITDTKAAPDRWSVLPDNGLGGRGAPMLVAAGSGLFVWGGFDGATSSDSGAFYDSATGAWRALPSAPLGAGRGDVVGVWTGSEVVLVGGSPAQAAAFDPAAFTWRRLPDPPLADVASATGRAAVVDGAMFLLHAIEDGVAAHDEMVRLDLASGRWRKVTAPPVSMSSGADVVAAGADVIVVGRVEPGTGCGQLHVLSYSPSRDTWRELPRGPVADRTDVVTAWTGAALFVGGGASCTNGVGHPELSTQAHLLDPTTGVWRDTAPAPAGFYSSYRYADVWTGAAVTTLTPAGEPLLYIPATDRWHLGPPINGVHPVAPNQTPFVVAGRTLVVSGGNITQDGELCCSPVRGTYVYTLPADF